MASNFLKIDATTGNLKEEAPGVTGGATDANKVAAYDANGQLPLASMPTGIGADVATITTSEALGAGALVNIYNASGAKVRKADASTGGKEAHGFVLAAVASGAVATVYFEGTNGQVTGLTPGPVFLSDTTPGGLTSTPPVGSGKTVQPVGIATSATSMNFEAGNPIIRA